MNEIINKCIYCNKNDSSTRDHVPPDCLFPEPKPKNMITVPCCRDCNQRFSLDDEFFRVCAAFQGTLDQNGKGSEIWNKKVIDSSFKRSPKLKEYIKRNLIPVKVQSSQGDYLGDVIVGNFNAERTNRVLERIVRGLYWHHTGNRLADNIEFEVSKDLKFDINTSEKKYNQIGDGVFKYWYIITEEDRQASIWALWFYKYKLTNFFVITLPDDIN